MYEQGYISLGKMGDALQKHAAQKQATQNAAAGVKEPGIADSLQSALAYLHELNDVHAKIRETIVGLVEPTGLCGTRPSPAGAAGIEELARHVCALAACAVGEARSIAERL